MHQWRCLVIIHSHEMVTAKDICEHTLLDKMTVSRAVRTLASRELIKLSPSPEDARRQIITLSHDGLRIYEEILPIAQEYETNLLSCLTNKEAKELDSTIQKLIHAADNLKSNRSQ